MKTRLRILLGLLVLWVWTGAVASLAQHPDGVVWRNLSPYVWLFQGMPVEATYTPSAVKSIQHASCFTPGGASFSAVDLNYAIISANGNNPRNPGGTDPSNQSTRAVFTSATTAACAAIQASVTFGFDVIEWVPSLLKHAVARDIAVPVGTGVNVNGTSATGYTVTLAKTTAFFQGCTGNNAQTIATVSFAVALPNTTQVQVFKNIGDYGFDCNVSVVEFK